MSQTQPCLAYLYLESMVGTGQLLQLREKIFTFMGRRNDCTRLFFQTLALVYMALKSVTNLHFEFMHEPEDDFPDYLHCHGDL